MSYFAWALASAVTACGGSTEPKTSGELVRALNQTRFGDLNSFSPTLTGFTEPLSTGYAPLNPAQCSQSAAGGAFVCPPVVVTFQVAHARSFTILDGAGIPMASYNAGATNAVRTETDISGVLFDSHHHHSDLTITGLLGSSRIVQGTSATTTPRPREVRRT